MLYTLIAITVWHNRAIMKVSVQGCMICIARLLARKKYFKTKYFAIYFKKYKKLKNFAAQFNVR